MKVLVTLDFPPETGGIQRYLHEMVMHTFTAEDQVITGKAVNRQKERDNRYPCGIRRLGFPGERINRKVLLVPFFWKMLHCVTEKQKHLVLAGNVYAAVVPWMLSFIFSVEYHVFCYGTELLPLEKKAFRNGLWKAVLQRAETVYYLTGATLRVLTEWYGCRNCIQRVPKIDLPAFSPDEKIPVRNTVHLLSVGRLVPHKGHALLIEASARLAENSAWHLTIAGNGPERQRILSQIRQRSLQKRITVRSDVADEELRQLYQGAEVFIFPSISTRSAIEGFGIVLLEAMAYGAAIIAARSGGIEEVVENNSDYAVLVPPGDVDALADAIRLLIGDGDRRRRMARAARFLLERRYVW